MTGMLGQQSHIDDEAQREVLQRYRSGQRFADLVGDSDPDERMTLHTLMATEDDIDIVDIGLPSATLRYPALTPDIPPAFWYERKLHDLFGVVAENHPRLDPLVLPHSGEPSSLPCPGARHHPSYVEPDERVMSRRVTGPGVFTIPHGPVRSGVFESVEYVVETPGEDIPHVNVRPFAKHRGLEVRFEQLTPDEGIWLSERVEGIASVAHALAFSHALEHLAGVEPPEQAKAIRVIYAELERIANHLDVALKLTDASGLSVATARFGLHKERILRLVSRLCGSRFGRGVVRPGGVRARPRLRGSEMTAELYRLQHEIQSDVNLLMGTSSFLDRLRGTGPLPADTALHHGVLGPVGRASGYDDDARRHRPYDVYPRLKSVATKTSTDGDVMSRLRVRWQEVAESFDLLHQTVDILDTLTDERLWTPVAAAGGQAVGWAEAPQGEVLYYLRTDSDGRILRCAPRSASFHNLSVFSRTFTGDVLTDFPFIEASFGVSIAGVVV